MNERMKPIVPIQAWGRSQDSNLEPLRDYRSALTSCATSDVLIPSAARDTSVNQDPRSQNETEADQDHHFIQHCLPERVGEEGG